MTTTMTQAREVPADGFDDPRDRSLPDDLRDAVAQARAYAAAEIAFQKSRVSLGASEIRAMAILLVAALVFAVLAVFALVFGLIVALTPLLSAWGATALVCGVLLALALVFTWRAIGHWRRLIGTLHGAKLHVGDRR